MAPPVRAPARDPGSAGLRGHWVILSIGRAGRRRFIEGTLIFSGRGLYSYPREGSSHGRVRWLSRRCR
ncbi:hypothetical protein OCO_34920 [Mycobacterium intracellulare MOTT-02]|uniref:Uncharacterized protein n=1 Tax=Mycobacterium intracellulare (strain ATCC 13950 / DSM 43223 / JCM 6384 / NCTC 13025 / 3600) TaxID=487521 RepID=H8IWT0_MYCIA|nr:hypothetical protein OCU_34970 [Mycobacterium intracellulare ATCC 13950]AFC49855.1 hypothetical protein OCO_34920 [Mycobacterium intracellulare MOTT-02]ASW96479.1 hypothetical protein CKJ67_18030 [Mycobacterium intracellulare]ETZ33311.1 hypothetical protein L843_3797 [Mycobacterium intracellulare MIN_061107_1834]PBA19219.1 hypothetical protein CKJ68_17850 [Mycobacterium intracellulare]